MNEVNVRNYPISSVEVLDVEELGIDSRVEGFCDETMTGVIIGHAVANSHHHPVHGIFAPRGYDKIKCYNNFNEMYLTDRTEVEAELLESLGVGDE